MINAVARSLANTSMHLAAHVVARKVSFGSQSDAGAKTRSSIMTLLHTVKKRLKDQSLESWLKTSLDRIAQDHSLELAAFIPLPLALATPSN